MTTTATARVTYRLATDADGPAIGRLYAEAAYADFDVDWARAKVRGWWLVAEDEGGRLVGAVQTIASQPYGYIGDVIVHPDVRGRDADGQGGLTGRLGEVARDLLLHAFIALRAAGSQMVVGAVGEDLAALKAVYERHGAMNLGSFTMMARRL